MLPIGDMKYVDALQMVAKKERGCGMEKEEIKGYQTKYFKHINKAIDIQQLVSLIQFGAGTVDDKRKLVEREEAAKLKMVNLSKKYNCSSEKVIGEIEQYGKIMQSIYFEIGVQIGICLQAELLVKQRARKRKY